MKTNEGNNHKTIKKHHFVEYSIGCALFKDSDWVFSLCKVLINDSKQVELLSIEAPEIENIWLANMVGDYFYYKSAYENEDGTITYKYNCFTNSSKN